MNPEATYRRMQQEKAKQELENKRREEEELLRKEKEEKHQAMLVQREVYREKAKNILIFAEEPEPPKVPKGTKISALDIKIIDHINVYIYFIYKV